MNTKIKTLICICTALIVTLHISPAQAQESKPWDNKRCQKLIPKLQEHKLPPRIFLPLLWRESRCTIKAIGWNYKKGMSYRDCEKAPAAEYKRCPAVSSYDSGLLQINSSWVTVTSKVCKSEWGDLTVLLNPDCNLKVAAYLYKEQNGGLVNWGFKKPRP